MRKGKRIFTLFFLLVFTLGILSGCTAGQKKTMETIADFEDSKIGVLTGSAHEDTVKEHFPNAERVYFNSTADMILAVEQEKIDGYIEDYPYVIPLIWEGMGLKCLSESVSEMSNGFIFPQDESSRPLREEINAFLALAKADGTIEALTDKWLGLVEPSDPIEYEALSGENGTIRLAISVDGKPILHQSGKGYSGFEMELLTIFAQQAGYAFEIEVVPFESIVAGIAAGKYDMGAAGLNITAEREESVDFSDPYAAFPTALVVKGEPVKQDDISIFNHEDMTVGIQVGSVFDEYAREMFPKAQYKDYTVVSDMLIAMEQGKIDCYIGESTYVTAARWDGASIRSYGEPLDRTEAGMIFPQDAAYPQLREQVNAFIQDSKENGLLDELKQKWFDDTEPTEFFDPETLTGENGTLKVVVCPDLKPLCYVKNGELVGYDIETIQHFAKAYGYDLEFATVNFEAVLAGVVSGKYDIGIAGIFITEERAQSVDFSDCYLTNEIVMVVYDEGDPAERDNYWESIKENFHKTFIREDRWKLIVDGIEVTMLISIASIIGGSLLGFGLYMLGRSDLKILQLLTKGIASVYSRIVAGTPVVVILMILFYVVFAKVRDMSGVVVAIITFALTFGSFVFDHMTVSVDTVDRGQTEAAYSLGYTKNQTFFRIILPQTMNIFMPSYCSQSVEVIKATAVVGYVAVNDLTKMGDIIRSNTYEAFFPLIATAVIYFLLTWILAAALGLVKRRFEPKRRSKEKILKGVKTA